MRCITCSRTVIKHSEQFQKYFSDIERVGKISNKLLKYFWNNFRQASTPEIKFISVGRRRRLKRFWNNFISHVTTALEKLECDCQFWSWTVVTCKLKLFWNNFETFSVFYFTYVTTSETKLKLFQPLKEFWNYFKIGDTEHVGKYSWAAIILWRKFWNNFILHVTTTLLKSENLLWRVQTGVASALCLSVDQAGFYVGYEFSGMIEKYSVADGMLTWSTEAHAGDVNTITELKPRLLCSAGSDCRVSHHWCSLIVWNRIRYRFVIVNTINIYRNQWLRCL